MAAYHGEKDGAQPAQPDGARGVDQAHVDEHIRQIQQDQSPQEAEAEPGAVKVDGDDDGGDGEKVDQGVDGEEKHELVVRGQEPDEEVDDEESAEGKVDLQRWQGFPIATHLQVLKDMSICKIKVITH